MSAYSTTGNNSFSVIWLYYTGIQIFLEIDQNYCRQWWMQISLLKNVFAWDLVEQHIWGTSAEPFRGNCLEASLKRGAASREPVTGISLSYASLPPGVSAYSQRNLLSLEGVHLPVCLCISVQGLGMQRWLNPWLSEKHARLPIPMTLNTHMAVLGKTNGRKMEYTSTAGTEREEDGIHPMEQPASIPLSHGEKKKIFIDFSLCFCLLLCLSRCFSVILPANHLRVVVDRNVGSHAVVVGAKVTVWCTKPFVKAIL